MNVSMLFIRKIREFHLQEMRHIEVSRGEYIAFVDSDDWIEEDMIQAFVEAAIGFRRIVGDVCRKGQKSGWYRE